MRNTFLITLLAFLSPSLIIAHSLDDSVVVRLNGIYVDEIEFFSFISTDSSGIGATAEVAFIIDESDGVFQSIGFESGYITAEIDGFSFFTFDVEINLIPIFVNYTAGGEIGESGVIWEAGAGLGGISIKVDGSYGSDNDVVAGGQVFGSIGRKFTESCSLLAGIRYMVSDETEIYDSPRDEILSSIAIDLSLNFTF